MLAVHKVLQLRQCFRAVTQLVFHILTQLGKAHVESIRDEERIVAETAFAVR